MFPSPGFAFLAAHRSLAAVSDRLDSIRVSLDRRLHASPQSLSQLATPFVAIPSQAIHHTASLCRMILTSPADACANPMHGFITGVALERARNYSFVPILHLSRFPLHLIQQRMPYFLCIMHYCISDMALLTDLFLYSARILDSR